MAPRLFVLWGLLVAGSLQAETGSSAWLRYAALDDAAARQYRLAVPAVMVSVGDSLLIQSARQELIRGIRGMLGRTLRVEPRIPEETALVLGTLATLRQAAPRFPLSA
ncbi:MAG: alpha-glucuronidase family glycosyl hydrolase, partial [Acidobacteriota bacterium]